MTKSKNLILKPLSKAQVIKYLNYDGSLERELKLNPNQYTRDDHFVESTPENILNELVETGKNHLFSTIWLLILKSESRIIGDIRFLGLPDSEGQIEFAYRVFEGFRKKGYMTEAVACILFWAKRQDYVNSIFAETAKDNIASWRILEKNNFTKTGETTQSFFWTLVA